MDAPNEAGGTVLLTSPGRRTSAGTAPVPPGGAFRVCAAPGDLHDADALRSASVLVLDLGTLPLGTALTTAGRLHIDHPRIQQLAVLNGPPPLPVAEYLVSCGAVLHWDAQREEDGRLEDKLRRLRARTPWVLR